MAKTLKEEYRVKKIIEQKKRLTEAYRVLNKYYVVCENFDSSVVKALALRMEKLDSVAKDVGLPALQEALDKLVFQMSSATENSSTSLLENKFWQTMISLNGISKLYRNDIPKMLKICEVSVMDKPLIECVDVSKAAKVLSSLILELANDLKLDGMAENINKLVAECFSLTATQLNYLAESIEIIKIPATTSFLKEEAAFHSMNLDEALTDLFKSGSSNVKSFGASIDALNNVASKYGMKNLQGAVQKAKQNFESAVMKQAGVGGGQQSPEQAVGLDKNPADAGKAKQISYVTTLIEVLVSFFKDFRNFTGQLPSMKAAMERAKTEPNVTVAETLPPQDQKNFSALIAKQLQNKSTGLGGFFRSIATMVKGGVTVGAAMQYFGLTPESIAQDIMEMTVSNFSQLNSGGAAIPEPKLDTSSTTNPAPTTPTEPATPVTGNSPPDATVGTQNTNTGSEDKLKNLNAAFTNMQKMKDADIAKIIRSVQTVPDLATAIAKISPTITPAQAAAAKKNRKV